MTVDREDLNEFMRHTFKSEMVKALNILEGMIRGIAIDGKINRGEMAELENWYKLHKHLLERLVFYDLMAVLDEALQDGALSAEKKADILWLCSSYTANNVYYDYISNDIQKLHGLLYGIIADNKIELLEIERLGVWLTDHAHLSGVYPYDELRSLILSVLQDGQLSDDERNLLKVFFSEFVDLQNAINLNENELAELKKSIHINGICADHPALIFKDRLFSFTGASSKASQVEIKALIESRGGFFKTNVVKDTAYLIVGNKSHPVWAFSCYGRKVDQAVKLRKAGSSILIVHENDFWDQLQD